MRTSYATGLRCLRCGVEYPLGPFYEGCDACATDDVRSGLTPTYDYRDLAGALSTGALREAGLGIWRYRRLLPVVSRGHEVSLGEGNTPLIPLPRIAAELGVPEVWLKDESRNPTLSFKDRHAAVALSKALDLGASTVIVASSGNHGLAVAAYAARAGLACVVLTYPGLALAASVMIRAYGARLAVSTREGRWDIMRRAVREHAWYPASNFTGIPTNSAYGHEGYKTIAFELHEQLGGIPDVVALPVGYGEGLYGIWKGFAELVTLGRAGATPRILAAEPAAGPLAAAVAAVKAGGPPIARVAARATVARGIGATVNSYMSFEGLRSSNGLVASVADDEILRAQRDLAREGIFAEPASAAVLAGARAAAARGELTRGRIVLINTSSGLKNFESIGGAYPAPVEISASDPTALETIAAP